MTWLTYFGVAVVLGILGYFITLARKAGETQARTEMERDATEAERRAAEVLARPRSVRDTADRLRRSDF